jgi:eukaryotic-like serine/threonine-protein kinase
MSDQEPLECVYWAFISYSSKDVKWARWLHRAVETYGIPAQFVSHPTPAGQPAPKRFRPLFRDRDELPAAAALGPQIEASLRASRYLIVVCSPNAARSPWVNKEILTFQQLGRGDRILALIVDGEPHAGDGRECFPETLRPLEPLAADARPEGDGKTNAKLKLLAGMLGVSFDALRQREKDRRIRRLQLVAAVALALMMAFAGLAWYANRQRVKAIGAREQAESVLEFLVFNLRNDLRDAGRLDIADKIRRRVDEYYIRLGTEASQPLTLHNQAVALGNEGMLLMEKGDLEGAWLSLQQSLRVAEKLAADHPDNKRWQWDVSVALEQSCLVDVQEGRLDWARTACERSLSIRESLAKGDPANSEWQHGLSTARTALGNVQLAQGDLPGALKSHWDAHLIMVRLTEQFPADADLKRDLGLSQLAYCDGKMKSGDPAIALGCYSSALGVFQDLVAQSPASAGRQHDLSLALSRFGDALRAKGYPTEAKAKYLEALQLGDRLSRQDPNNSGWEFDVSATWSRMGDVLLEQGDLDRAQKSFGESLLKLRRLTAADRTNVNWQRGLYGCYLKLAQVSERTRGSDAKEWYRMAYEQLRDMKILGLTSPADEGEIERLRQKAGG